MRAAIDISFRRGLKYSLHLSHLSRVSEENNKFRLTRSLKCHRIATSCLNKPFHFDTLTKGGAAGHRDND